MRRAFTNGTVLTMVPGASPTTALVIDGDRVVAAGGPEIVPPDADVVDVAGATITPGFIDAHNHLSIAALHPVWNDVHGVTDVEVLLDAIRAQAAAEPDTAWVRCQGIDVTTIGLPVTRDDHFEPGTRKAELYERQDVLVVVCDEQHGDPVGDRVGQEQGVQHHPPYRRPASGKRVTARPPKE